MKAARCMTIFLLLVFVMGACNPINRPAESRPTRQPGQEPASTSIPQVFTATSPKPIQRPTRTTKGTQVLQVKTPLIAPSATTVCLLGEFVEDVSIPDGTTVSPGSVFTKIWRIRNIGFCPWDSEYFLRHDQGEQMGATSPIYHLFSNDIVTGQTVDIAVEMTAPSLAGSYTSTWLLIENLALGSQVPILGTQDGYSLDVKINVVAQFSVTEVRFAVDHTGLCGKGGKYTVQASIRTNGAGVVKYHWVRSDGVTTDQQMIKFMTADIQSVTYTWDSPIPHTGLWLDLYIDSPNNQQFGRAYLNCP